MLCSAMGCSVVSCIVMQFGVVWLALPCIVHNYKRDFMAHHGVDWLFFFSLRLHHKKQFNMTSCIEG